MFMWRMKAKSKARGVVLLTKSGPTNTEESRVPDQNEVTRQLPVAYRFDIQHNISTSNTAVL